MQSLALSTKLIRIVLFLKYLKWPVSSMTNCFFTSNLMAECGEWLFEKVDPLDIRELFLLFTFSIETHGMFEVFSRRWVSSSSSNYIEWMERIKNNRFGCSSIFEIQNRLADHGRITPENFFTKHFWIQTWSFRGSVLKSN